MLCCHTEQQEAGKVNSSLHGYQKKLLDCVSKGGNHIIVAPTGSGKTRVAVELAGLILGRKPTGCIVFLTQTVALAEQQAGQCWANHFAACQNTLLQFCLLLKEYTPQATLHNRPSAHLMSVGDVSSLSCGVSKDPSRMIVASTAMVQIQDQYTIYQAWIFEN